MTLEDREVVMTTVENSRHEVVGQKWEGGRTSVHISEDDIEDFAEKEGLTARGKPTTVFVDWKTSQLLQRNPGLYGIFITKAPFKLA